MSDRITSPAFEANARRALGNETLQTSLRLFEANFVKRRRLAAENLPEFDALRDAGREIKDHTLAHLDLYLEAFEAKVTAQGGHVHFAPTAEDARATILSICRRLGARTTTKGKSMISEEIALNEYLEANGVIPIETDVGEYIIQMRHEMPSHIIAPAVHLTRAQVEADFRSNHDHLPQERNLSAAADLLAEARGVLRDRFLAADVGITGANILVAETGSVVVVTNEGNADLAQTLPKAHIVLASIEKMVPTLEDATTVLRLLGRSATGQEQAVYTTFSGGPRREGDLDGPGEFHVVLLDNGRSKVIGTPFQPMLRCIRCGACMNHCPVYQQVGGHAYGWVYGGPMGSVLTPTLIGIDKAGHLPNASTFCGRCEQVCPMHIPLPEMMRQWRNRQADAKLNPSRQRAALALWATLAKNGWLYRLATRFAVATLAMLGRRNGRFRRLPLAGRWTSQRDLPAPAGETFQAAWKNRDRRKGKPS